jgi:AraC family transcriptional regulator
VTAAAREAYRQKFRKVLEHVDAHLDGPLSVEALAAVVAFSKFHFHRQFSELLGMGVHRYVQLVRLRRATYELAFSDARVIDVALASGYESHEAFARAFKKIVGQTPSEFRDHPRWDAWHASYQPVIDLRSRTMTTDSRDRTATIVDFPETRVAVLEHRGDPNLLGNTVRDFIAWRRANRLPPAASATFNIHHCDPNDTPPEEFRLDVCAALPAGRRVEANDAGVVERTIPGGRCAVVRHVGSDDTLGETVRWLYAEWLPGSGEELRDFPLFMQRVTFGPEVPAEEAVVDVFLALG